MWVRALAALGLAAAAMAAAPGLAAARLQARGSAEQVYATGLRPGAVARLLSARGRVVAARRADSLGGVVFRAIRIAQRADDLFGMLVAAGIGLWFLFQSFVNVGMTIGITPITGLPLPFVSYGGSAIFADMIAIGLLQSVRRHRSLFE